MTRPTRFDELTLPPAIVGAADRFVFSRESVRKLDAAAIDEFNMVGAVLMENAATALLACALEMIGPERGGALILCGPGNNGGDGFALARRLAGAGVQCCVARLCDRNRSQADAALNLNIIERMGLPIERVDDADIAASLDSMLVALSAPVLIVDAIFGTGLTRPPREPIASAIAWLNRARFDNDRADTCAIISADIPSGLGCDTGEPIDGHDELVVRADVTVTLAGLKQGFLNEASRRYTGSVVAADIGAPIELLERFGKRLHG